MHSYGLAALIIVLTTCFSYCRQFLEPHWIVLFKSTQAVVLNILLYVVLEIIIIEHSLWVVATIFLSQGKDDPRVVYRTMIQTLLESGSHSSYCVVYCH